MGGVRRVTSETDEPVEVGRDEFCEMLNVGNTRSEHCFSELSCRGCSSFPLMSPLGRVSI